MYYMNHSCLIWINNFKKPCSTDLPTIKTLSLHVPVFYYNVPTSGTTHYNLSDKWCAALPQWRGCLYFSWDYHLSTWPDNIEIKRKIYFSKSIDTVLFHCFGIGSCFLVFSEEKAAIAFVHHDELQGVGDIFY